MKMNVVVVFLIFCCFSSSDECDEYAAEGNSVSIPLNHKWTDSDRLKWRKENAVLFYTRGKTLITKNRGDIHKNGSLKLTNVTKADEGNYIPEVYDSNGMGAGVLAGIRLCVLEQIRKPNLTIKCKGTKKEPNVEFICNAQNKENVEFEWSQNGKVLEKEKTSTLKFVASKVENQAFSCRVSNRVSFMISDSVTQTCYKSGFTFPEKLFGYDSWLIVGAGAGIVVLLIILVIICCLRTRRTKRMRLKDEEELRLGFTHPQQPPQYSHPADRHQPHHQHQHLHQHQHQHQHRQQQPAGHTGPRQHRSKHRNQPLPKIPDQNNGVPQPSPRRSAQVPKPANDEQPPPLPQPRKKNPRKV